jgi:hypothetical protein
MHAGVFELGERAERARARVQRDGGHVAVHDEDVIEGGLVVCADREGLGDGLRVRRDLAVRDAGVVQREIVLREEFGRGAGDRWPAGQVEVAAA